MRKLNSKLQKEQDKKAEVKITGHRTKLAPSNLLNNVRSFTNLKNSNVPYKYLTLFFSEDRLIRKSSFQPKQSLVTILTTRKRKKSTNFWLVWSTSTLSNSLTGRRGRWRRKARGRRSTRGNGRQLKISLANRWWSSPQPRVNVISGHRLDHRRRLPVASLKSDRARPPLRLSFIKESVQIRLPRSFSC